MKKSKIIVFLLSLFILCISVVKAKENPFALDWKNDDKATTYNLLGVIDTNLVYGDGYVNFRLDMNKNTEEIKTIMRRYDHEGNIVKEKKINDKLVVNATTDGEYIYVLQFDIDYLRSQERSLQETYGINTMAGGSPYYSEEVGLSVIKYDGNFTLEEQYDFLNEDIEKLDYNDELERTEIMQFGGRLLGYDTMTVDENGVYLLTYGMGVVEFDKELQELSYYEPDYDPESNTMKKYFDQVYQTSKLGAKMDNGIISLDSNEQNIAYTSLSCVPDIATIFSMRSEKSIKGVATITYAPEETCDLNGYIGLTDSEGKTIWEKDLEYDLLAINVKLIGDYVVAVGLSEDGTEILVYDLEGNLVQNITTDIVGYTHLVPTKNGFIVSKNTTDSKKCYYPELSSVEPYSEISDESQGKINDILDSLEDCSYCVTYTTTEVYHLPYNINKEITGEGELEVKEDAYSGEEVEVKASPKFGWKIDKLIVRDANGNEIEVKDGKFVMPSSEVTIEVTFTKIIEAIIENPNTASISITGLVLFACALGYITYKNYKKVKFLK